MEMRTQGPPADLTDPHDFAMRGLGNRRLEHAETLDINGLKGWTAVVRNDPSPFGQSTNVRYIIIYYNGLMWVFKGASRSNTMSRRPAIRTSGRPRKPYAAEAGELHRRA